MARPEQPKVLYLDSSAFIAAIKAESGSEPIQQLLEEVDRGRLTLIAATASLVEVRGGGRSHSVDPLTDKRIRGILEGPSVVLVELDRIVAAKARDLTVAHHLRTWDAVHLASAIVGGAEVLMTIDNDFPLDTMVEGVWVCKPYHLGDPNLFTVDEIES